VFHVAYALGQEWAAYQAELTRLGLRDVTLVEFMEQTRACAESDLDGQARTAALGVCDQWDEWKEAMAAVHGADADAATTNGGGSSERKAALIDQFTALNASVAELWKVLGDLSAEFRYHQSIRERYLRGAPLVAAEMFVRGWADVPVPFEADRRGRVTATAWRGLERYLIRTLGREGAMLTLHELGAFAATLGTVSDAEGKG
jgi:hypothetical protein